MQRNLKQMCFTYVRKPVFYFAANNIAKSYQKKSAFLVNGQAFWRGKSLNTVAATNLNQDRQCTYSETPRRVRANIVVVEKQWVLHNISVCICSLRYPECNAHTPLSSVACPALQYLSKLPHKRHDFRNMSYWPQNVCFDFLYYFCPKKKILILRRNEQDMILKNVYWSSCKVPLFLSDFNKTRFFRTDFRSILKYQISWKSAQREPSCSMRTDGQTDITTLRVAFRNSANAPKNSDQKQLIAIPHLITQDYVWYSLRTTTTGGVRKAQH
jgi:hypothetical protein